MLRITLFQIVSRILSTWLGLVIAISVVLNSPVTCFSSVSMTNTTVAPLFKSFFFFFFWDFVIETFISIERFWYINPFLSLTCQKKVFYKGCTPIRKTNITCYPTASRVGLLSWDPKTGFSVSENAINGIFNYLQKLSFYRITGRDFLKQVQFVRFQEFKMRNIKSMFVKEIVNSPKHLFPITRPIRTQIKSFILMS